MAGLLVVVAAGFYAAVNFVPPVPLTPEVVVPVVTTPAPTTTPTATGTATPSQPGPDPAQPRLRLYPWAALCMPCHRI
ncbi:MAG: hypothetical protein HC875_38955 [Anaerolineales bacterium]|nr:hypothetical protein [Anaerolineales bacterium]